MTGSASLLHPFGGDRETFRSSAVHLVVHPRIVRFPARPDRYLNHLVDDNHDVAPASPVYFGCYTISDGVGYRQFKFEGELQGYGVQVVYSGNNHCDTIPVYPGIFLAYLTAGTAENCPSGYVSSEPYLPDLRGGRTPFASTPPISGEQKVTGRTPGRRTDLHRG